MSRRLFALLALASALVVFVAAPSGTSSASDGSFFVGFAEDQPKWLGQQPVDDAASVGGTAFRVSLVWEPGQTALDASEVDNLTKATQAAGSRARIVLSSWADSGAKAPVDAAGRDAYCSWLRDAATRFPSIRDVIVWNEPNLSYFWRPQFNSDGTSAAPAAYAALTAQCYDVLHAARADVNVLAFALGPNGNDNASATSNVSHSPGNFIRAFGDAYRASGRQSRVFDTVAHHVHPLNSAERPWRKHVGAKPISLGDWNKLMYNLYRAFDGTAQPIPGSGGVSIWYTEAGYQTIPDAAKAGLYTGSELDSKALPDDAGGETDSVQASETSAAPDQRAQLVDSIRLAYCQPYVAGYFVFLLYDEANLAGWQSGLYWADRTPKDSREYAARAISETTSRATDCGALKFPRPSGDFMPPSAPTGTTAEALKDPLRVTVSWQPSSDDTGVTSYRVYRNGAHVGTTSGATTWTNASVASGATYTYTVRALDAAVNLGDASPAVTVTTPDVVAPSAPAVSAAPAANPARVDVTWAPSTDNVGVAGYDVYRDGIHVATTATAAYTDTAIASATTYRYEVVAFDAAGNRSAPGAASATTGDTTAPSVPAGVTARGLASPNRVELAWSASTDNVGVARYDVYRNGVLLGPTTTTTYVDTTAATAVTYTYEVRAVDAAGNASAGATATAAVPDVTAPTAPTGLSGTAYTSPRRILVQWAAATDDARVAGYRVYRNGVQVATTTNLTWSDYNVVKNTTYRYAVRAYDAAGNLGASSTTIYVKAR